MHDKIFLSDQKRSERKERIFFSNKVIHLKQKFNNFNNLKFLLFFRRLPFSISHYIHGGTMTATNLSSNSSILLSELHSLQGYLDRLLIFIDEFSDQLTASKGKKIARELLIDSLQLVQNEVLTSSVSKSPMAISFDDNLRDTYQNMTNLLVSALDLPLGFLSENEEDLSLFESVTRFLNIGLKYAHQLHELFTQDTEFEIELPRSIFYEKIQGPQNSIPFYYIVWEDLKNALLEDINFATLLNKRREQKYKIEIINGHKFIQSNKIDKALQAFKKAQNFSNSAEILTLISWAHSLQGEMEKAKNFCFKAIKIDSNYGPAFNDLGNFYMKEKEYDQALHWFSLAKKAVHYENKEYPYINSARVYLSLKNKQKALEEFSFALTLAPDNIQLHETVTRLRESMDKDDDQKVSHFFNQHFVSTEQLPNSPEL